MRSAGRKFNASFRHLQERISSAIISGGKTIALAERSYINQILL
jgi:hypothetical protein